MKEERLLADIASPIVFAVATILFTVGWLQTSGTFLLGAAVLTGLITAYLLYRVRRLYIR